MDDEDLVMSRPLAVDKSQTRVKRQIGADAGVQFCYSIGKFTVTNISNHMLFL